MKAINGKNKKMLFSLIWGMVVLTGCPQPNVPGQEPVYPNNLTQEDKDIINNASGNTYEELLQALKDIKAISSVNSVYGKSLENIIAKLDGKSFDLDTLKIEDSKSMTSYVLEEKNLQNATNADEYNDLKNQFEDAKMQYENFYNETYSIAYQELLSKYYDTNANIQKNQYNELIKFMEGILVDFQDDYLLNTQTAENLEKTVDVRVSEAEAENVNNKEYINNYNNSKEKSEFEALQIDLSTLEQLVVDAKTAADNFSISYDNSNTGGNENPGDNPENPGDNPENPGDNPENPGDNPENPGDNPENPGNDPENPGDDPENPIDTTDYTKLEMFENVDDVWTMKELPEDLTKYSEQTSVSYNIPAGEEVAIDIDMLLSNKEKLEKANVPVSLNIPSDSTISFYKDVYYPELDNTIHKTSIDFLDVQSVIDFVLGDKIDEYKNASDKTKVELPNMNLSINSDDVIYPNFYGTGVDKVIEMYYNTDNKEKLNYDPVGGMFDAVDALQDGKMYDEENNFIDAYALDINAALLMGVGIGNVKVVGENKTEIMDHELGFYNTRFETDLTGFVFNGAGSGIIDYAGSAPALTLDGSYGKTIIRKPSENMIVKGGHTVDLSNVENSSLLDNIAEFRGASEIYYKTQEDATRGYSSSSVDAIYIGDKLYSKDNTYTPVNATNQQWIDASNNDLWSEGQDGSYYPKDVHNEAEEWADTTAKLDIKTVNKDILQKILENNQKSYS